MSKEKLPPLVRAKQSKTNKPNKTEINKFLEKDKEEYGNYAMTKEQLEFLIKQYFDTKKIFGLGRDRIFQKRISRY